MIEEYDDFGPWGAEFDSFGLEPSKARERINELERELEELESFVSEDPERFADAYGPMIFGLRRRIEDLYDACR